MGNVLQRSKLKLKKGAPTILTFTGGVGVVATAVMAVRATPKALKLVEQAEVEKGEELTKLELVKTAGPVYIPTILIGAGSIACIFGANVLNKRQQASLTSAYALLDNSYREYKKKVKSLYGEDGVNEIATELAKDKYEESDVSVGEDKQLFYDDYSGRYFESTITEVTEAKYRLNRELFMRGYVYLNEFYEMLDIPPIDSGDEVGWTPGANLDYYWQEWIDFSFYKTTMDDGLECIIMSMLAEPILNFEDYM